MAAIASIAHRKYDVQNIAAVARSFPMLSAERELELSRKLKTINADLSDDISDGVKDIADKSANRLTTARDRVREALICPHLRKVVKMAMAYRKLGLPMEDLIQEGTVGLTIAVDKFEPEKGFRLSTYAQWWIRASLQEYVFNHVSSVKIANTSRNKKIIKYLTTMRKKALAAGENPFSEELMKKVAVLSGAEFEDVKTISLLAGPEQSLNAPIKQDDESMGEVGDMIADGGDDAEEIVVREDERYKRSMLLEANLAKLEEREREIFRARRLKEVPETLEELSERFRISRERVRQIEVKAFDKLAEMVRQASAADRWASQDKRFNHSQASVARLARPAEPAQIKAASSVAMPKSWVFTGEKLVLQTAC